MTRKKTPQANPSASDRASQSISGSSRQVGEGSYEGTRDYQKGIKTYLEDADVAADARAARPANEDEASELRQAEQQGRSRSKAKDR